MLSSLIVDKTPRVSKSAKSSIKALSISMICQPAPCVNRFHKLNVIQNSLFISFSMAGPGMNVEVKTFRKLGIKAFGAGLIGSALLAGLGYFLVLCVI